MQGEYRHERHLYHADKYADLFYNPLCPGEIVPVWLFMQKKTGEMPVAKSALDSCNKGLWCLLVIHSTTEAVIEDLL